MTYPVEKLADPNPWLFESRPHRGTTLRGVMIHATRSGVSIGDDGPRTVRWMKNLKNGSAAKGWGSSCDEVIHEDGKRTLITPDYRTMAPTYGAGYGDVGTWSAGWYYYQFEVAQGSPSDAYTDAQIASLAERTLELAALHEFDSTKRILFLNQTGNPPEGICTHEDSANGVKLGKSDPGGMFPWLKFMALLGEEDWFDMATEADLRKVVADELDKKFGGADTKSWRDTNRQLAKEAIDTFMRGTLSDEDAQRPAHQKTVDEILTKLDAHDHH